MSNTFEPRTLRHLDEVPRIRFLLHFVIEPGYESLQLEPLQSPERKVWVGNLGCESMSLRAGQQFTTETFRGVHSASIRKELGQRDGIVEIVHEFSLRACSGIDIPRRPRKTQGNHVRKMVA